jgi:hypothetical protein
LKQKSDEWLDFAWSPDSIQIAGAEWQPVDYGADMLRQPLDRASEPLAVLSGSFGAV